MSKKWSYILLIAFLPMSFLMSYAQQDSTAIAWNQKNEEGLPTGKWRKFHANGNLRYIGQFENGKEIGIFKYYNFEGQIKTVLNYLGTDKAMATHYHANGNVKAKGLIRERKKDSIWNVYTSQGVLLERGSYISGRKFGLWTTYYENGQAAIETYFENDLEQGKHTVYFTDGNVKQEANYENGFLEGLSTFYDAQGNKILKGKYYRGTRDGRWIYYEERLEVEKVLEYDKGRLLNPEEAGENLEEDSEMYKSNRKDALELEDLKGRISYE